MHFQGSIFPNSCRQLATLLRGILPGAALVCLGLGAAEARTINWGGIAFGTNIDSTGAEINAVTFTFELGVFELNENVFGQPSLDQTDLWASQWRPFDAAVYSSQTDFFTSGANVTVNQTSSSTDSSVDPTQIFPAGAPAYIWAYNSKSVGVDTEWLLVTNSSADGDAGDNWLIPVHDERGEIVSWNISKATTVLYGALGSQRNDTNTSDVITGEGFHSDSTLDFTLQTYRVQGVIPEPSSILLASLGLGGLFFRRRRMSSSK